MVVALSRFIDTSNWQQKDGTTLAYSDKPMGETSESILRKRPNSIQVQVNRMSVLNETSWQVKGEIRPDSKAGYSTREYIRAVGLMDNCKIYGISLDDRQNDVFTRLEISIHPMDPEELARTSTIDRFDLRLKDEEMPDEGWLKDELGFIRYLEADEYQPDPLLFAALWLSSEKFDHLVEAIKTGNIGSARLDVVADLYKFDYESFFGAGLPGHPYNYAILREDKSIGSYGLTRARLQEVLLEWSPKLENRTAGWGDDPNEADDLDENFEPIERDTEKSISNLSRDVKAIRGRIDLFYQAALLILIVMLISRVASWLGQ